MKLRLFGAINASLILGVVNTLGLTQSVDAANISWTGQTGDWSTASNWSSDPNLPGSLDNVTINVPGAHTITLNTFASVNNINMTGDETLVLNGGNGGNLSIAANSTLSNLDMAYSNLSVSGSANLTITDNATLTRGEMVFGTTNLQGTTTINPTGAAINGVRLNRHTLRNTATGTATWISGYIDLDSGFGGGGGTFNNEGVLIAATSDFKIMENNYDEGAFNNSGLVDVQGGGLALMGNGTHTGNFSVAAGTSLQFGIGNQGGTNTLSNGPTGLGEFSVRGGTVTVNGGIGTPVLSLSGGTLAINANSTVNTFDMGSGTLSGTGDLTVTDTATFSGGIITGIGTTTVQGKTEMSHGPVVFDAGRTLRNSVSGILTWGSSNYIDLDITSATGGGTFVNEGLFIAATTGNTEIRNTNGKGSFDNQGTFRKTGVLTNTVLAPFTNTGIVDVQGGTLALAGGSTSHTGSFSVAAGSVLEFDGGTHTLSSSPTGSGTVSLTSSGTILDIQNDYTNTGTVLLADGTRINVQSTFNNQGVLSGTGIYNPVQAAGLFNAGTIAPGDFVGALTVEGDLTQTASGILSFDLGSLSSFDTLNVQGDLILDGILELNSFGNFNPNDGDSFTIITFDDGVQDSSDLSGAFSGLLLTGFDPGVSFDINYLANSIVLEASFTAVPVPPAVWLFGSGLLGLTGMTRRKKV